MRYDFDTILDRRAPDAVKWAVKDGELPMWVADMDFRTAPEILEALQKRLDHGVFGYSDIPEDWYRAYADWWGGRHGLSMEKGQLTFCTGVVPALSSIVRKLTTPNENVLIQTPVYNVFWNSIENNGRRVLESPLRYEGGAYFMDLEDLERKMADPQTTLMILCNPQNPVGKIWDRETLAKVGELARRHGVTVISDEIHCDITVPGRDYVPFASASETCREISVTCVAPTKTFNLAGLQTAAVFAAEPHLRHRIRRALNTDEVAEPNAFACAAAVAAFRKGAPWLEALRSYLGENRRRVDEYLREHVPGISLVPGEATYLLWLDLSGLGCRSREFTDFLRAKTGLFVTAGSVYGASGDGFLRMNVACPRVLLEDGLDRLCRGAGAWQAERR